MSSLNPFDRPTPSAVERRFRRIWLGLIVAAVFCAVAAVAAQAAPECQSIGALEAELRAETPAADIGKPTVFEGEEAQLLVAAYNAEPPATDHEADTVVLWPIMRGHSLARFYIALFADGCSVEWAHVSPQLILRTLGAAT